MQATILPWSSTVDMEELARAVKGVTLEGVKWGELEVMEGDDGPVWIYN